MNPLESSALGLSELLEKRFTLGDKASSILPPKGGTMNYPALATLSGCVLLLASAAAQTKPASWTTPSASEINAVYPEVESLYFDFHRTPELAMHEQQTARVPPYFCALTWTPFRSQKKRGCRLPAMSSLRAILERPSQLCMLAVTISTCPVGSAPRSEEH